MTLGPLHTQDGSAGCVETPDRSVHFDAGLANDGTPHLRFVADAFRSATEPSAATSMPEALSRSRVSGAVKAARPRVQFPLALRPLLLSEQAAQTRRPYRNRAGRIRRASVYPEVRSCAPQS